MQMKLAVSWTCQTPLFEDPGSLPDIDRAAERLARARSNEETVVVYGDFDADGVTGTALLIRALRRYGLRAVHYIPHRVSEGHGLNRDAVTKIHEQGTNLIVTVDCGVTNIAEVDYAHSLGIDTIITDHHVVTDELPSLRCGHQPTRPALEVRLRPSDRRRHDAQTRPSGASAGVR